MSAGIYDITIDQNASLQIDAYWKTNTTPPVAINVTGYKAKIQIRSTISSPAALETLTTENGGIIVGGSDGHIQIIMTPAQTAAITWTSGVYDLILISGTGFTTRLLQGSVTVNQAVTTI